jgi:hypothetical protein
LLSRETQLGGKDIQSLRRLFLEPRTALATTAHRQPVQSYQNAKVQLPDLQRITAPFAIKKIHIAHGIIHKCKDFTSGSTDMPKSDLLFRRAAGVILLSAASSVGVSHAAAAGASCLSKPNRTSSAGSHWYYRIDRATHRHCWYLKPIGTKQAGTRSRPAAKQEPAASASASSPNANAQPGLVSWFNSVLDAAKRPYTAPASTGYANIEPDAAEPIVSEPAPKPARRARASRTRKNLTRRARRPSVHAARHAAKAEEASVKTSDEMQATTSGQGQTKPIAQAPAKIDDNTRTELFLEFLRWRGRREAEQ